MKKLTLACAFVCFSLGQVIAQTGGFANVSIGGTSVTVSSASQLLDYISRSGQYTINVSGTINLSGMNDVASDKAIIGVGTSAKIIGGGLDISGVSNVVIQNISFSDWDDDAINIQQEATNVWIDHCNFSNGYDGCVDVKRGSDYITISWNHFSNHHKTCLLGHSDSNGSQDIGHLRVTYHHNYFDNTQSRHPRVRFSALCHVYNNYYVGNDYGVASTEDAEVLVEGCYFQNVSNPTHVGYASSGPGDLVQRYNTFSGSGSPETRGSVPEPPYSYSRDNSSNIPSIVSNGAGANGTTGGGGGSSCNPTSITPYLQVDGGSWQNTSSVTISSGSSVKFGPQPNSGGSWSWNGCGTSGSSREQTVSPTSSCTSTATYTNSCGATSSQTFTVNVSGGGSGGGSGSGNITVRARGVEGSETIDLRANGSTIGSWTLGTSYQDYSASGSGTITVYFTNDDGGRDVQVDYVIIDGTTYQSEDQATNTGVWQDGSCGGSYSEWLHCGGYIQYGSSSGGGSGGTTVTLDKHGSGSATQSVTVGQSIDPFYYTWTGATTVTTSNVPAGINVDINTGSQRVDFSGAPTQSGTYNWSVSTVGGSTTMTKEGTFTVSGGSSSSEAWLEAECGTVGSLWDVNSDGNASNGYYVTVQSGNNSTGSAPSSSSGQISYSFNVSSSGSYNLWARVIMPSGTDDSFWIRMDGGSWYQWNNVGPYSNWTWDDVQSYSLSAGNHTLEVAYREDGAQMDKLYIGNSTPSGSGSTASNLCTPGGGSGSGTITVRARGVDGSETIDLRANGNTIGSWTLGTSYQNYSATGSGSVTVYFTNDASGRDVQVDYVQINGTTYQAENQPTNTGVWQDGSCGGSNSEWLHCNGYIDFSQLRSAEYDFSVTELINVYPNPANDHVIVKIPEMAEGNTGLSIYNKLGQVVYVNNNLNKGENNINLNELPSGIYIVKIVNELDTVTELILKE